MQERWAAKESARARSRDHEEVVVRDGARGAPPVSADELPGAAAMKQARQGAVLGFPLAAVRRTLPAAERDPQEAFDRVMQRAGPGRMRG
jgi:hypothetical protein